MVSSSLSFCFVRHFEFSSGLPLYVSSQTPVPGSPFPTPRSPFPVPGISNIQKKNGKLKHHILPFSGSADHIRVHSSPAHFSIFRCHSGSFRFHSCPFPFIPASFCLVPVYFGPFRYIPFRSIPFLCLVTPESTLQLEDLI